MKLNKKPSVINRQIAGLIIDVIVLILLLCCIINSCFLGDFFIRESTKSIEEIFSDMYAKSVVEELYAENYRDEFLTLCDTNDLCIVVVDEMNTPVLCSLADTSAMVEQCTYSFDNRNPYTELSKGNDKYKVIKQYYPKLGEDYVILIGRLADHNRIMIRSSIEGISKASHIANKFMINTAILGVVIAIILTNLIVVNITKPVFNLIEVTKKIANLDFEAKYVTRTYNNEIDTLGEHINAMSKTLEQSITQLKVANDELMADLELREETENMRKEFISNVSHELKTPIALIQGYAEGLQEGIIDDENSRKIYLDVIIDESNKMNRLVREMLILNQLEAGQMEAEKEVFNVTDIIRGILASNKLYFEAQNINFKFKGEKDEMVLADEFLVEQVATNFISNAIHYVTNENKIEVAYTHPKKNKLRIGVYNSGNNIPEEHIEHIWEKFYKVDKARSREYGGSGIGLSVVKASMELLGEDYGVINKPKGVEFWFMLSLQKQIIPKDT